MNWIFSQASSLLDQNIVLIRNVDAIFCITSNQTIFDNIFAFFLVYILAYSFRRK